MKDGGDATLVLMGVEADGAAGRAVHPLRRPASDRERLQALEAATVVVCPSPYESLSLLALEALSVGTPILVNARSAVLVEHCVRSNGGLYYADRRRVRRGAEAAGRATTGCARRWAATAATTSRQNYRWDVVLGKYERLFAKIKNAR